MLSSYKIDMFNYDARIFKCYTAIISAWYTLLIIKAPGIPAALRLQTAILTVMSIAWQHRLLKKSPPHLKGTASECSTSHCHLCRECFERSDCDCSSVRQYVRTAKTAQRLLFIILTCLLCGSGLTRKHTNFFTPACAIMHGFLLKWRRLMCDVFAVKKEIDVQIALHAHNSDQQLRTAANSATVPSMNSHPQSHLKSAMSFKNLLSVRTDLLNAICPVLRLNAYKRVI